MIEGSEGGEQERGRAIERVKETNVGRPRPEAIVSKVREGGTVRGTTRGQEGADQEGWKGHALVAPQHETCGL